MYEDVKNWGKGLPELLILLSRVIVSFGSIASEAMDLVRPPTPHRLLRPKPGIDRWLDLYRYPRRVRDAVADLAFPVRPGEQPISSSINRLVWMIARARSKKQEIVEWVTRNPVKAAEVGNDVMRMVHLLNRLQMREMEREWLGLVEPHDAERRDVVEKPEVKFLFRVWTPCIVLHQETPSRLFRRARFGNMSALDKLLRIDKAVMFEPRVAELIWSASVNDWTRYGAICNAIKSSLPPMGRKKVKQRFLGLASHIHQHRGGIDSPRLRELADGIAAADSGGKVSKDPELNGEENPEALTRAIHRERPGWDGLLHFDPDKQKS